MKTFTFEIDDSMVCSTCQHNDKVHYNLFAVHNGEIQLDPGMATWCGRCEGEADMVNPNQEFPYGEIFRDDGNYFNSWADAAAAGYSDSQIWCVTTSDHEHGTWFCYDNSAHFVNVHGFIATKEHAKPGECYEELLLNEENV